MKLVHHWMHQLHATRMQPGKATHAEQVAAGLRQVEMLDHVKAGWFQTWAAPFILMTRRTKTRLQSLMSQPG